MRKFLYFLSTFCLLAALSGCHEDDFPFFHFITPEPPPLPVVEPEVVPEEEVGESAPDPTPEPPCELVKGNISSSGEKIFHVTGGAYYDQVKINEAAGEAFFCSEQEAVEAGFRKSSR